MTMIVIQLLLLTIVIYFIYSYRVKIGHVIRPLFIAIIISYLINPLVLHLERKKISPKVGILIVYFGVLLAVVTLIIFVIPELINNTKELINTIPDMILEYENYFNGLMSIFRSSKWSDDIKITVFKEVNLVIQQMQNSIIEFLKKGLSGMVDSLAMVFNLILALVIAYYLVKDASTFKSTLFYLIPQKWKREVIAGGREINIVLVNFIQGQLLAAAIVGSLEVIALLIVGVKFPLILGLLGGIANIIPYFGPILGAVPAVAVALVESPIKALWTVAIFVIVQQIDNILISPKIIQGKIGLHPVATILVVLAGGEFFGITGMLFAVPVTAMLKIIFRRIVEAIAR